MTDTALIRNLLFLAPAGVLPVLWMVERPGVRRAGAVLLATLWCLPPLLLVHEFASRFGWWSFAAKGGLFRQMPVDLWIAWALFWGAIPALAMPRMHLAITAAVLLSIDLLSMPLCAPLLRLGPDWFAGDLLAMALCCLPAQCLARWTVHGSHLAGRAILQVFCFGGLTLWILPVAISPHWPPPGWLCQLLCLPAVLGLSAVQEFVEAGGGTPVPFDPPRRLVTSGVYAYVRAPMQLSMLVLLPAALAAASPAQGAVAALILWAYGGGYARWDERRDLAGRFGARWLAYSQQVPAWIPRRRPWIEAGTSARLHVSNTCAVCRPVGVWIRRRHPAGLEILPAEEHPSRALGRASYEGAVTASGVEAIARALGHIDFAWALAGAAMRLPGVRELLQLLVDASGGGPRRVTPPAPSASSTAPRPSDTAPAG